MRSVVRRRFRSRITLTVAVLLVGMLLAGCESWRHEYGDARAAKLRYRECLQNNPGDPDACRSERAAANDEYRGYKERGREQRGCDTDPRSCR
jgi:hypothetical protein